MRYTVMQYGNDQEALGHRIVDAETELQAAEIVVGKAIVGAGPTSKLVAVVWKMQDKAPKKVPFYLS